MEYKTGILTPVLLKEEGTLRHENFLHVVRMVVRAGHADDLVVAQQLTPRSVDVREMVAEVSPLVEVVTFEVDDDKVHKSKLVNLATEAHERRGKDYALMIDADIHMNVAKAMEEMQALDPTEIQAVKPFRFFIRLNLQDSAKVRSGLVVKANTKDYPDKEIVKYPAAGAWGYAVRAWRVAGKMDESYTGWGWEDTEFSLRLRNQFAWKTLGGAGFHLEHENDRAINKDNFEKFVGTTDVKRDGWEKMAVHVRRKICVLSAGRGGSTLIAKGLGSHPDIEMYYAEDERDNVRGTAEMFDPVHFSHTFPPKWNGYTVVEYISKKLSKESTANFAGFKLMADQPSPQGCRFLLRYMARQPHNYKTILVIRESLWEQGLSYWLAQKTEQWVGEYAEDSKVTISPEEMRGYLSRVVRFNIEASGMLPEALVVSYETVKDMWEPFGNFVLQRLDLRVRPLDQRISQQRKDGRTLESMVGNAPELAEAFPSLEAELMEEFPGYGEVILKADETKEALMAQGFPDVDEEV